MFEGVYKDRKVLVTGHTGFKGSWLTTWLRNLGADVCGFSDGIPSSPSMFEILGLGDLIRDIRGDVRDYRSLRAALADFAPDLVFHLAAQPIVSLSYEDPMATVSTNVMGVANILEAVRDLDRPCTLVVITSDKCYHNVEWEWGYRETDELGGKDIYSGSKGAAELVFRSYFHSFFKENRDRFRLGTTRAGNVIGGGDWAKDRLVPDCFRAWSDSREVTIRSPRTTRPWEHVLEPLSGYLEFGARLYSDEELSGESFNFGPTTSKSHTVVDVIEALWSRLPGKREGSGYVVSGDAFFDEAKLLKLNCDKAYMHLRWLPTLDYDNTVRMTGAWYSEYYDGNPEMLDFTRFQIDEFCQLAQAQGIDWAIQ